jgi:hypothetical protein
MISAKLNQADVDAFMAELRTFAGKMNAGIDMALEKAGQHTYAMIDENIGTHAPRSVSHVFGATWKPLSPLWVLDKEIGRYTLEKWAQTGEIEASVHKVRGTSPRSMFIGISRDDSPDAYDKSIMNEFGHKRPLFITVGNKVAADMGKGAGTINEAFNRVIIDAVKNTWGT